jgi:hypothetical protein
MATGRLARENPCPDRGIGRRKPAQFGPSNAVSTGNSICVKKNQRRREILRLMSRCPRHYSLRALVTWGFDAESDMLRCENHINAGRKTLICTSKKTTIAFGKECSSKLLPRILPSASGW